MPRQPLVTVLMSVHNDERLLPQAVESILAQTMGDFEFLIIDDGSTDGSGTALRRFCDSRVRLLRNGSNLGLTRSLNIGLSEARGTYIARMDADDVAEPDRFARQVNFLRFNPNVGLLGTGRTLIDEHGDTISIVPAESGRLRVLWKMLLGNAFAHPTVMLRRGVLERHHLRYDERFQTAQDYELWVRLLQHTAGDNLPEPLVRYRLREGISRTRKPDQLANHDRIACAAIRSILPDFEITPEEVTQLRGRFGGFSAREAAMDPADAHWRRRYVELKNAFTDSVALPVG